MEQNTYPVAIVALSENWRSWAKSSEGFPTKKLTEKQNNWMKRSPKTLELKSDWVIEYYESSKIGYLQARNTFINP
jgi:hypothetical protein